MRCENIFLHAFDGEFLLQLQNIPLPENHLTWKYPAVCGSSCKGLLALTAAVTQQN